MLFSPVLLLLAPLLANAFKIQTFKDCNCEDPTGGQTIKEGLAPVQWREYKLKPTQSCSVMFTAENGDSGYQIYADFPSGRQLDKMGSSYKCYRQTTFNGIWGPGSQYPALRAGVASASFDLKSIPPPVVSRKRSEIARLD